MKPKSKNLITGILLIAVGVVVIVFTAGAFGGGFAKLWPFAVVLFGLVLSVYFFSTRKKKDRPALIFLGAFLLASSVILFILALGSYEHIEVLWPGFISALGLGFLSVYLTGDRKKAIYAVSLFLIGVSVLIWIFYSLRSQYGLVIGVSIFVVGVGFLTRSFMKEISA
jgi:hypothetical protein